MAVVANRSVHPTTPKFALLQGGSIAVLSLFERLSSAGYPFDMAKWEVLVNAGLLSGVPSLPANDCQVPLALETRIRSILSVAQRLPSSVSIEKLAFFSAIDGLDAVPVGPILSYICDSIERFFAAGDGMVRRLLQKPARIGPAGERRLADELARAIVREYPPAADSHAAAYCELASAAFMMYFRSNWENRRPQPQRRWQRIITPEFLDYQTLPVKTIADAEAVADAAPLTTMEPAADKDRILGRLLIEGECNPDDMLQAVKDAATIVAAAAPRFPDLGEPPLAGNRRVAFAAWVLSLVLPLLAAGLFRVTLNTRVDRYTNLMPSQSETGLESVLRAVLLYWHT